MKIYSFEEILSKGLNKNLVIKDKFYCNKCGLLLVDEDTAHKLESFYYNLNKKSIYIDICKCKKEIK